MKRDPGQRERKERREKASKKKKKKKEGTETEGPRQGRRRGWMERRRRGGIMQPGEETDRLKTFRGGIC